MNARPFDPPAGGLRTSLPADYRWRAAELGDVHDTLLGHGPFRGQRHNVNVLAQDQRADFVPRRRM